MILENACSECVRFYSGQSFRFPAHAPYLHPCRQGATMRMAAPCKEEHQQ